MNIRIKKASGEIEDFNPEKLLDSLVRSGADREQAEEVVMRVVSEIEPLMSTKKIYRLAHKYLKQYNRASTLRYSLKKALMRLGPTGYPFEKYIGKLLGSRGYEVKVGVVLQGKCISHEVDVLAEAAGEVIFVECKYRNSARGSPDVKTAMYVHSRFNDLIPALEKNYRGKALSGWLVTNTRFTSDAVRYAECTGMVLKSWGYPEKDSLEKIIEHDSLYPVTVMSGLNNRQIKQLTGRDIVLMKDLAGMDASALSGLLSITGRKAGAIIQRAGELCFG